MWYNKHIFTNGGRTMLAVNGYYDGTGYITEGNVAVKPNQRVIITYLDEFEKPKRNLKKYRSIKRII